MRLIASIDTGCCYWVKVLMLIGQRIRTYLLEHQVPFEERTHGPAQTCEESARQRGEELKIGGKTLLMKDKKDFRLFVISAALKADNNKIRKLLKSQKLRFATAQELKELVGVEKGALPPFGRPILPYDLYIDESITYNQKIAFNNGALDQSIVMPVEDYLKLTEATICRFACEEGQDE